MSDPSLQRAVDGITWYHDFDFGNGLRAKSHLQNIDDIRPIWRFIEKQLDAIDFRGKSVLEIGTWDGYWRFEAERRGGGESSRPTTYPRIGPQAMASDSPSNY